MKEIGRFLRLNGLTSNRYGRREICAPVLAHLCSLTVKSNLKGGVPLFLAELLSLNTQEGLLVHMVHTQASCSYRGENLYEFLRETELPLCNFPVI